MLKVLIIQNFIGLMQNNIKFVLMSFMRIKVMPINAINKFNTKLNSMSNNHNILRNVLKIHLIILKISFNLKILYFMKI